MRNYYYNCMSNTVCFPASDLRTCCLPKRCKPLDVLMNLPEHANNNSQNPLSTLLIVDDEQHICLALKRLFRQDGYTIYTANSPDEARNLLEQHHIHVIISDQRMPQELGTDFLQGVQKQHPNTVRMILSAYADINDITQAMDAGAIYKFLTKPWDDALLRANIREAFNRANELATPEYNNIPSPNIDTITGLGNRQHLAHIYSHLIDEAHQQGSQLLVMTLHLDQYEPVLTHLGEHSSHVLLKKIAAILVNHLQQQVELGYAGEGIFCLLAKDIDVDTCLTRVTDILKYAFADSIEHEEHDMTITFSIGAEDNHSTEQTFDIRYEHARAAMFDAMVLGHSGIRVYDRKISATGKRQLKIENDLFSALDNKQFSLVYQPQIALADGKISGFEALLRWNHPELGSISPVEFIPICEKNRLIVDIGLWVLEESLKQFSQWQQEKFNPQLLSVNVSPIQMQQAGLADTVLDILNKYQWPIEKLVLEITETADLIDTQINTTLQELGKLGITLAIDDFGTGYANFTHLTQLPIKKVKIDRSLILSAASGEKHRHLFDRVVTMSHELGFETIVEGVETPEELAIAANANCHIIQGYFYSPPLGAEQCKQLMNQLGNN